MKIIALLACIALASATPYPYIRHESKAKEQVAASVNSISLPYYLPGRVVNMYGYAPKNGKFQIDLVPEYEQGGYSLEDAVCLRMVVDIDTYHIVRNAFAHGSEWFAQEDDGYSGLLPGRYFTMSIICQMYGYEIVVNGYHFATFYHRIPITQTMWITVDPHVRLEPMEYY